MEIRVQPESNELMPGAKTMVPIILVLERAAQVRGVHARFHGAEESKAIYTTYNAATKSTQTHTAVEHVNIVKREYLLSGKERMGFFGNLADGLATLLGGGKHDVLGPGDYSFEVEIEVPPDARPTFTGKMCRVFYELSVRVDIPAASDTTAQRSFTIAAASIPAATSVPVRTRYPEDEGRGLWDTWFGPDVKVEVALAGNVFRPNDLIEGIFRVDTPKSLACHTIDARLVGVEQTTAKSHKGSATHQEPATIVATPATIQQSFAQEFSLTVACDGPATTKGKLFSIDWYVQIHLDVPWAKNPKIRVPVILLPS